MKTMRFIARLIPLGAIAAAGFLSIGPLRAQTRSFEVASIKPASPEDTRPNMARNVTNGAPPEKRSDHGNVNYARVSLQSLVLNAYNLLPSEVTAPGWMADALYDVTAKAPAATPFGQVPAMLQSLLADRWKLKVHWETQQKAGYALTAPKGRGKLKLSLDADGRPFTDESVTEAKGPSAGFQTSRDGTIKFQQWKASMERFAKSLGVELQRPVVDQTGLRGYYDFSYECSLDSLPGMPRMGQPADAAAPTPAPSIFAALKDLGLELVKQTVTVKRLVVDSALKVPTAN
jgi:uncharacterized protein (TIGR03435 family)